MEEYRSVCLRMFRSKLINPTIESQHTETDMNVYLPESPVYLSLPPVHVLSPLSISPKYISPKDTIHQSLRTINVIHQTRKDSKHNTSVPQTQTQTQYIIPEGTVNTTHQSRRHKHKHNTSSPKGQ